MRAVVTGGAGFLGSHLCDKLLAEGWDVLAVDNFITGAKGNLSHLAKNKKFKFLKADVSKPLKVAGKVGYVLHFASPASPPDYLKHPIATMMVGSVGTQNALELDDGGLRGHAERAGTGAGEEREIFSGFHERMLWRSGSFSAT